MEGVWYVWVREREGGSLGRLRPSSTHVHLTCLGSPEGAAVPHGLVLVERVLVQESPQEDAQLIVC